MKKSIGIALLLLSTGSILACSCTNNVDSVRTSFQMADLALRGRVISIEVKEANNTVYSIDEKGDTLSSQKAFDPAGYLSYKLVVEELYKGEVQTDTLKIRGPARSSCLANLSVDGTYFVFANINDDGVYYSDYCSGNKSFNTKDQRVIVSLMKK